MLLRNLPFPSHLTFQQYNLLIETNTLESEKEKPFGVDDASPDFIGVGVYGDRNIIGNKVVIIENYSLKLNEEIYYLYLDIKVLDDEKRTNLFTPYVMLRAL